MSEEKVPFSFTVIEPVGRTAEHQRLMKEFRKLDIKPLLSYEEWMRRFEIMKKRLGL